MSLTYKVNGHVLTGTAVLLEVYNVQEGSVMQV